MSRHVLALFMFVVIGCKGSGGPAGNPNLDVFVDNSTTQDDNCKDLEDVTITTPEVHGKELQKEDGMSIEEGIEGEDEISIDFDDEGLGFEDEIGVTLEILEDEMKPYETYQGEEEGLSYPEETQEVFVEEEFLATSEILDEEVAQLVEIDEIKEIAQETEEIVEEQIEKQDISLQPEYFEEGLPPPPPPIIYFNEIDCIKKDWVELYNPDPEKEVDVSGWLFTDDPNDPLEKYYLPQGSIIKPNGFLVILQATDQDPGFNFGIKCGVDTLFLIRPDGSVADKVAPPVYPNAYSWGRYPDGQGDWQKTAKSPGAPNALFVDESQVFFQLYKMPEIDIFLSQQAIESLKAQPRVWTDAKLQFIDENGDSEIIDVGIHIKGKIGSFKPYGQKSAWKIKLNWKDPEYRFFGKKKLTLNNMVQDASMIHEVLSYTISRSYGIPSPRTGYVWVKVNGEDFGLYLNVETYDDCLLDLWLPSTKHLFEAEYGLDFKVGNASKFEVDEGDLTDVSDLTNFIKVANDALDTEWWDKMTPITDLVEMTKNWAVEIYIGHWDGYAPTINNYYTHVTEEGIFRMFMSGTDQTFANHWAFYQGKGLLFQRCLANTKCRNQYDIALGGIVPIVDKLDLVKMAQDLASFIEPWVQKDPKKPYSFDTHKNSVKSTINFLIKRRNDVAMAFGCLAEPNPDKDGDGYLCSYDCNDDDPNINPGAYDTCNDGIDEDCSGFVDDGPDCPCPVVTNMGHKYLVCTKALPWLEARKRCTSQMTDMVKIDNQSELDFIYNTFIKGKNIEFWIGLNDKEQEGKYLWIDGTEASYTNWASGQPNNAGDSDCVKIKSDGKWDDRICSEAYPVLCEEICADANDKDKDGFLSCVDDCDDNDPKTHPWAKEICNDGKDQNCNGVIDDPIVCQAGCEELVGTPFVACRTLHSWQEGRSLCKTMGADLATFYSEEEHKQAYGQLIKLPGGWGSDYWIGLNDIANEGIFVWPDNSQLSYGDCWEWDQPNNGNGSGWDIGPEQDCVTLNEKGKLNDRYCEDWFYVLCR